jgi:hypothetical protein
VGRLNPKRLTEHLRGQRYAGLRFDEFELNVPFTAVIGVTTFLNRLYGSILFGQFFGVSNQEHSMGSPLAVIEPKTSIYRGESRFSSSSPVSQALCLEKHCYTGRSLVLFFKSFWSDLASA